MIKLKKLLKEDDYLKDAMNNGKKIRFFRLTRYIL